MKKKEKRYKFCISEIDKDKHYIIYPYDETFNLSMEQMEGLMGAIEKLFSRNEYQTLYLNFPVKIEKV